MFKQSDILLLSLPFSRRRCCCWMWLECREQQIINDMNEIIKVPWSGLIWIKFSFRNIFIFTLKCLSQISMSTFGLTSASPSLWLSSAASFVLTTGIMRMANKYSYGNESRSSLNFPSLPTVCVVGYVSCVLLSTIWWCRNFRKFVRWRIHVWNFEISFEVVK